MRKNSGAKFKLSMIKKGDKQETWNSRVVECVRVSEMDGRVVEYIVK